VARQAGADFVLSIPFSLGIGGAVQTGIRFALAQGYERVVQIDGDGQHDPRYLGLLVEEMEQSSSNIVIGKRIDGPSSRTSFTRRVGIAYFSWLTSVITGHSINDCSSGFRLLDRKAMTLFADDYPVDFPDAEALVLAHISGLRIDETATPFRNRGNGRSSLSHWRFLYYPFKETISIAFVLMHGRVKE
jgi:hypothetical protein